MYDLANQFFEIPTDYRDFKICGKIHGDSNKIMKLSTQFQVMLDRWCAHMEYAYAYKHIHTQYTHTTHTHTHTKVVIIELLVIIQYGNMRKVRIL